MKNMESKLKSKVMQKYVSGRRGKPVFDNNIYQDFTMKTAREELCDIFLLSCCLVILLSPC